MDERIIGSFLIIIGLTIAGFGGTMSSIEQVIFYIGGFLTAFAGLGFFIKYRRRQTINPHNNN